MPRIDLHAHTAVSDGTDSPAELIAQAAAHGIDVIAITDHDTTAGWDEAAEAGRRFGVHVVCGSEISTRFRGIRVHLLCYLQDPDYHELHEVMAATRRQTHDRSRQIVDLLAEDYPISWDDVAPHVAPGTTPGRPHIADALVAADLFTDRASVFATIFAHGSRYQPRRHAPDTAVMVRLVREAGGVPVLAHPAAITRGPILPDEAIAELAQAGLFGLEVHHRDNPKGQQERLLRLATEYGLAITGSSDYHGAGKPNQLGEFTTAPQVLDRIESEGFWGVVR